MSDKDKPTEAVATGKPKLKICCACPETKSIRDECVVMKGKAKMTNN